MKKLIIYKVLLIMLLFGSIVNASAEKLTSDSLLIEFQMAKSETIKVDILNKLTLTFLRSYPDSALFFAKQAETIAVKLNDKIGLAESYKNIGNVFNGKDNFINSNIYYHKALKIYTELQDTLGIAKIYNNMGALNRNLGNLIQSLEYYQKSLELRQQIGDYAGMAKTYNNIGIVHNCQNNKSLAINYFQKSLKIRETYGDRLGLSGCYNNIGAVYMENGDYERALKYFTKSLETYKEFSDKLGISHCYTNIGITYSKLKEYPTAISYLNKSLLIKKELGRKMEISSTYNEIAKVENKTKNYKHAISLTEESLAIADNVGVIDEKKNAYEQLHIAYEGLKDYKKSLYYHKQFLIIKDQIFNIEKVKELQLIEAKFQSEKKQLEIENLEKENQLKTVQLEKMNIRQIFSYMIILVSIFIIISLTIIRKKLRHKSNIIFEQHEEITAQKDELEDHRINLEKLILKRTIDLEKALKKAEESDRLKSAFLANMSHEIRTPLNAIVGFSELMTDKDITFDQHVKYSEHIRNNSNSLLNLITDIIDIAKFESGSFAIEMCKFDLHEILNEIYESYKQIIFIDSDKYIDLTLDIGERNTLILNTDKNRLKQILSKLLSNAIKFTEKGEVRFGYTIKNAFIQFYVTDTGVGIAPDEINNLFKQFRKTTKSSLKLYRGAGLGLAISRHIAELLGGKIWVESTQHKGSKFSFTIPMK